MFLGACRAGPVSAAPVEQPIRVAADWDDLQAAMEVAVEAAQCAIVASRDLPDGSRRYELVTVRGLPGELVAWRDGDFILARTRLGRFGDPDAESILLRALSKRLGQLRGVEWAPR